jgi:hypothetical protein
MTATKAITSAGTAAMAAIVEDIMNNGGFSIGNFLAMGFGGAIVWFYTRRNNTTQAARNAPVLTGDDVTPLFNGDSNTPVLTNPTTLKPTDRHRPTPITSLATQPTQHAVLTITSPTGVQVYKQKITPEKKIISEEGIRHMGDYAPGRDAPEVWQHMAKYHTEVVASGPVSAPLSGPWGGNRIREAGPTRRSSQGGPGYRGDAMAQRPEQVVEEEEEEEGESYHDDKENANAGPFPPDEDENEQGGNVPQRRIY